MKYPQLIRNPISLAGGILAVTAFGGLVFFLGIQALAAEPNPYVGMLVLVGLPAILLLGLVIIPVGMMWEARRRAAAARRGEGIAPGLVLDFGNPRHLRGVMLFGTITTVIVGALGSAGIRTVEFMDSPGFCGGLCHTVMEPQYEPYKRSAHAEVDCVKCHIGPGAGWYVQSKLSGARQLFAVLFDTHPRPVPAPITHLRPARDTCEGCHWREKAYGMFLRVYRSYLPNKENTLHVRALAFRVGAGGDDLGEGGGVHWHTSAQLWYSSVDQERQIIASVTVEKPEGVEEWLNPNVPVGAQLEEARLMDCIDCHNRAAHKIPPPDQLIDEAITAGRMDPELPYLKREALRLLGQTESVPEPKELVARWSQDGWFEQLEEFYQDNYPDVAASRAASIQGAIDELRRISEVVLYPDMETAWFTYADNRGHPDHSGGNSGCFRCHSTLVRADDGVRLPGGFGGVGCTTCHGLGEGADPGGPPIDQPSCIYCHVSIPLDDLERAPPDALPQ